jgi:hypothetical protein
MRHADILYGADGQQTPKEKGSTLGFGGRSTMAFYHLVLSQQFHDMNSLRS